MIPEVVWCKHSGDNTMSAQLPSLGKTNKKNLIIFQCQIPSPVDQVVQQMCNNVEHNCNTETTIDIESSDHVPLSSEKNKKLSIFVDDREARFLQTLFPDKENKRMALLLLEWRGICVPVKQ